MLERLNVLVSFGIVRERSLSFVRSDWDVLLDSGAFNNFKAGQDLVSLEAYSGFLTEHGRSFWRYISLDRIGDPLTSRQNFEALRTLGLCPVPVFQRGAPRDELYEIAEKTDFIAIGGIAGSIARSRTPTYVAMVMRETRKLGIPVHLLGIGSFSVLLQERPFSADSSDYSFSQRYGLLQLWEARTRRFFSYRRGEPLTRSTVQLLDRYRVRPKELEDPQWWLSRAMRISLWSAFHAADYLRRIGVKYFIVVDQINRIAPAWEEYQTIWGRLPDELPCCPA